MPCKFKTIKKYPRYEISRSGLVRHREIKKIRKTSITNSGYRVVTMQKDNCVVKNKRVIPQYIHKLVAETYLPAPATKNKNQINHKNLNKLDNRASNLEWCTCSENQLHYHRNKK